MRLLRLALLAAATACLLPAAGTAAEAPNARLTSMAKAIDGQDSVHYVSVQRLGATTLTIVCDAGRTTGIQRITYREGQQSGRVTVIVAKRTAYIRGDVYALQQFMGFSPANAKRYANAWLLVPNSNDAYPTIAEDVTFASAVSDLRTEGTLASLSRRTVDGHAVVGVRGTSKAQGQTVVDTLWIAATGKPLPVSRSIVGESGNASIAFSAWNKPVTLAAPRGAIDPTKPAPPGVIA